jgi:hypothetical protein
MEEYVENLISFIKKKTIRLGLSFNFKIAQIVAVGIFLIFIQKTFCLEISLRDIWITRQEVMERVECNPMIKKLFQQNIDLYVSDTFFNTFKSFFHIFLIYLSVLIVAFTDFCGSDKKFLNFFDKFDLNEFLASYSTFKMLQDEYYMYSLIAMSVLKDDIELSTLQGLYYIDLSKRIGIESKEIVKLLV